MVSSSHSPSHLLREVTLILRSCSWGVLILTGLGAIVITITAGVYNPRVFSAYSFTICTNISLDCRSFADTFFEIFPSNIYEDCGCIDFCSTYNPNAPMRRGTNLVAWSANMVCFAVQDSKFFAN